MEKVCKTCRLSKPLNTDYFGHRGGGRYWQSECRECMKKRSQRHRDENPDHHRDYDAGRRANRPRARIPEKEKLWLWHRTYGLCLCCGESIAEAEIYRCVIDHDVPLCRGGADARGNRSLAHPRCNSDKHKKTMLEHWEWRWRTRRDAVRLTLDVMRSRLESARESWRALRLASDRQRQAGFPQPIP
jgi:HNH endonuclease